MFLMQQVMYFLYPYWIRLYIKYQTPLRTKKTKDLRSEMTPSTELSRFWLLGPCILLKGHLNLKQQYLADMEATEYKS